MIKVKKQIIKDNVFQGYRIIEVADELVEEQLALEPADRHPHWKTVSIASEEDLELWGGKKTEKLTPKTETVSTAKTATIQKPKTVTK